MSETFTPDKLIAGDYPIVTESVTVISGADAVRGAILGRITASGKYKLTDSTATDGSENPVAILLQNTASLSADVTNAPIALSGEFNEDEVVVGNLTFATRKDALRALNIYLKSTLDK